MSFPKYERYKDSGVEWLDEVPEHWEVIRLGALFREVAEGSEDGLPILSVSIHNGISDRELSEDEVDRKVTRSDDTSKYKKVIPGDLVYNMMRAWQGGFGAAIVTGMVSPAYVVARPMRDFSSSFVEFLLRTPRAIEEMRRYSQGVTDFRLRLYWDEFKSISIALPSMLEQDSIMALLDREVSKIDSLVQEQHRLIESLKEKRQAVISHVVTKGLDPGAPTKPSGVEWLADVPEHWSVEPVAYRYSVQLGKMLDSTKITGVHLRPYLRVFDVQWGEINTDELPQMDFDEDARSKFRLIRGDLLVNEGGSYPGRSALWSGKIDECYYQKALHRLRPHRPQEDTTEFIYYVMCWAANQGVFVAGGNETTIEHLPAEKLRRYRFTFPPMTEQAAIASFLDSETAKLDALAAESVRSVELLQERRSALISAAVTGKIDVRGLVPLKAEAA